MIRTNYFESKIFPCLSFRGDQNNPDYIFFLAWKYLLRRVPFLFEFSARLSIPILRKNDFLTNASYKTLVLSKLHGALPRTRFSSPELTEIMVLIAKALLAYYTIRISAFCCTCFRLHWWPIFVLYVEGRARICISVYTNNDGHL